VTGIRKESGYICKCTPILNMPPKAGSSTHSPLSPLPTGLMENAEACNVSGASFVAGQWIYVTIDVYD
jgi:hypothetical protein